MRIAILSMSKRVCGWLPTEWGGHDAGEVASSAIVEQVSKLGVPRDSSDLIASFQGKITDANDQLQRDFQQSEPMPQLVQQLWQYWRLARNIPACGQETAAPIYSAMEICANCQKITQKFKKWLIGE